MASNPTSTAPAPANPLLVPLGDRLGKNPLKLLKTVVVVGCDEHCHLHLKSTTISRHHALIIQEKRGVYVRDLGSRTKVVVNGQPQREVALEEGDEIHFGRFSFKYSNESARGASENGVAPAQLIVNGKPQARLFNARTLLIGRGEECDVDVSSEYVSSRHAVIFTADGKRYVRDLDSRTGTFVNNKEVHQQEIKLGDEIKIGPVKITLAKLEAKAAPVVEAPPAPMPAVEEPIEVESAPEPIAVGDSVTDGTPAAAEEPLASQEPESAAEAVAREEPVVGATASAMPVEPVVDVSAKIPTPPIPIPVPPLPSVGVAAAVIVPPIGTGGSGGPAAKSDGEIDPAAEPASIEPETSRIVEPRAAESAAAEPRGAGTSEPAIDLSMDDVPAAPEFVAEDTAKSVVEGVPAADTPIPVASVDEAATTETPDTGEPVVSMAEPPVDLPTHALPIDVEAETIGQIDIAPMPIVAEAPATEPEPVSFGAAEGEPEAAEIPLEEPGAVQTAPAAADPLELAVEEPPIESPALEPIALEPETPVVAAPNLVAADVGVGEQPPAAISEPLDELPEFAVAPEPDVPLNILEPTLAEIGQVAEPSPAAAEPILVAAEPLTEEPVVVAEPAAVVPEIVSAAAPVIPEVNIAPEPEPPVVEPAVPQIMASGDDRAEEAGAIELASEPVSEIEPPATAEPAVEEPVVQELGLQEPTPREQTPSPVFVEPELGEFGQAPMLDLTDAPAVVEPQIVTTSSIGEAPDHAVLPPVAELPTSEPDIFTPPVAEFADEPVVPPLSLDLSDVPELSIAPPLRDEPVVSPAVPVEEIQTAAISDVEIPEAPLAPAEPEAAPSAPIAEKSVGDATFIELPTVETPAIGIPAIEPPAIGSAIAGAAGLAASAVGIPAGDVPTEEPPKRRVRKPRAAPAAAPKPKKPSSRARVKRKPPTSDSETPVETSAETQPPTEAEPVLDQLALDAPAVDAPPASTNEVGATVPPAAIEEITPVVSPEVAEELAPPAETPVAPMIEVSQPVDSAPPMESGPIDIAPAIELAPPEEISPPQIVIPMDLAPPAELPVIADSALSHEAEQPVTQSSNEEDWQPPPAAEEEISPPYVPDEPVTTVSIAPTPELHAPDPESIAPAPELVASSPEIAGPTATTIVPSATLGAEPMIDLGPSFIPPVAPPRPAPEPEAPMSSLGGMGAVNLDQSFGGLPTTSFGAPPLVDGNFMIGGGIPVELPPLPQTPEWFGKVNFDFKSKPKPAPPLRPPPPPPKLIEAPELLDDEPILQGRLTINAPPAAPQSIAEERVAEAPAPQEPAPSSDLGEPETPVVAPPMPKPAAPAPKITPPTAAAPKVKPPPPSFAPRPRRGPFSTDAQALGEADLPADHALPEGPVSGSMPFDGLAMPVQEADVFSNFDSNALHVNDAAFGGTRMSRPGDFHIPETPESAERRADDPDYDFADDDFWNRTDEEDDLAAKAKQEESAAKPAAPAPLPPKAQALKPIIRSAEKQTAEAPPVAPPVPPAQPPIAEIPASEPEPETEPESEPEPKIERPADPLSAEIDNASEASSADIPQEPLQAEDMNYGEHQNTAVAEPFAPRETAAPQRKRRRFRIPFLMPMLLVAIGAGMAAVYFLTPIASDVSGTLSFLNFSWTPGTQDSIEMEASQRRYLQDVVRPLALDDMKQVFPGTSPGFLDVPELYSKVISSVEFSGTDQTNPPRTYLTLRYKGLDKDGDRLRMLALLQGLAQANAPLLDGNHRLRDAAQKAQRLVDDDQKKVDDIKNSMAQMQSIIDAQPSVDDLTQLASRKADLERAKIDAEQALTKDQATLTALQKWTPTVASSTTQPEINDPLLSQMRQQLADLSAEADAARSDQVTAAVLARQNLENAAKQFNDQIASANEALGTSSQLRQFVDSAMNTQSKARDLINMLIVDGEDLEEQLEDTRRQMDDLIEARQAEIWASDDQLHQLRDKLQSAQHRYNANAGQGVNDPRILDPIQKEIDDTTTQIKARQAQLGVDPSEIKVQESINHVIVSLRNKLQKEKQQIDAALDPLEKQLSDLDPTVSALPQAQQDLARLIRERLQDLNNARTKYAKTVGEDEISPSAKVADLQTRMADLKSRIAARKIELASAQTAALDTQHQKNLASIQARVAGEQKAFDTTSKDLETGAAAYEDARARHDTAITAQRKKIALLDDQRTTFSDLQTARRDRDEKQAAADHAFDIAPVTDDDVHANPMPDPRNVYMLIIACGGLIAIAFVAFFSHSSRNREIQAQQHDEVELNLDTPPEGMLR